MRKEEFYIGDYVHVFNRGYRKQPIVRDTKDKNHFLQMLYYFNTKQTPSNPFHELNKISKQLRFNLNQLIWPTEWGRREPLVEILAFTLKNNHYHLILKEIKKNGIAKFMQRIGTGMTMYFNTKYKESGALFHGSYKAKRISDDRYLKYLSVYVQVKNVFELYPGGFKKAVSKFDKAYDWAVDYPYSSLGDFTSGKDSKILSKSIRELFSNSDFKNYKDFSRDCLRSMDLEEIITND